MNILSWGDFLSGKNEFSGDLSITVGVFDGVHRGHQGLINELKSNENHRPIVFTFGNSPMVFLRPETFLGPLSTLDLKVERLKNFGVNGTVIIDFSLDFSKLTGKNFLDLLLNRGNVQKLVLGQNHRFGNAGDMGPGETQVYCDKRGIELAVVPPVQWAGDRVSSTRIRHTIINGDMALSLELIGSPYGVDLRDVKSIEENGVFRIKREWVNQLLPPAGNYSVQLNQLKDGFATEVSLDDRWLICQKPVDVPYEKIFFLN